MFLNSCRTGAILLTSLYFLNACGNPTASQTSDETVMVQSGVYENASGSPLLPLIAQTRTSLDIEIYEMQDESVIAAIAGAAHRGVQVRVVMEPQPVAVPCKLTELLAPQGLTIDERCNGRLAKVQQLKNAGVTIVPFSKEMCGDSGNGCYQHGKLVISDRSTALVSTGNFNSTSLCNTNNGAAKCNRDYTIVTKDSSAIATMGRIFEGDFKQQIAATERMVQEPINENVTVSPNSHDQIIGLLGKAQKSIKIQAQYLKEPGMNAAIIAAAKRGVDVQLTIASNCSFTTYLDEKTQGKIFDTYNPMLAAGVKIKFYTGLNRINDRPAYMHAKLILIDDKEAWVGSINGSPGSFFANREYGVIFSSPEWVSKLNGFFANDFASPANEILQDNLVCKSEKQNPGPADESEAYHDESIIMGPFFGQEF